MKVEGRRVGKKEKSDCKVFATKTPASTVRIAYQYCELELHISIVLSGSWGDVWEGGASQLVDYSHQM